MIWPDSIEDKLREYEKSGHATDGRWLTEKGFPIYTIISSCLNIFRRDPNTHKSQVTRKVGAF